MKKTLTKKTVTTVKKPRKYTKKLKEKQHDSTSDFVDKINYFKEKLNPNDKSDNAIITKDIHNTLKHIENEYSEKYNIENAKITPINFLIKTSLNARDDLPVDKVVDISFQWDLKKSFWSNKLVFDRRSLKHSTESDFSITFRTNRLDLMPKISNFILRKVKFDINFVRFDELNTMISNMKLVNSHIKSITIPESTIEPRYGNPKTSLILNFICEHVVIE